MILDYMAVALGGAFGAVLRVWIGKLLPSYVGQLPFPILCVNVIGCCLMGIMAEVFARYGGVSESARYFLISGVLGGFTTFSAFALESGVLFQKQILLTAILYVGLSVMLSIGGFFMGAKLVKLF